MGYICTGILEPEKIEANESVGFKIKSRNIDIILQLKSFGKIEGLLEGHYELLNKLSKNLNEIRQEAIELGIEIE